MAMGVLFLAGPDEEIERPVLSSAVRPSTDFSRSTYTALVDGVAVSKYGVPDVLDEVPGDFSGFDI
jgi:hypothetical protein